MNSDDLAHFTRLLKERSGIELQAEKAYLVQSRLAPIAGASGFESVAALLQAIRTHPTEAQISAAVDALTTNETYFYRDMTPFDHLRAIILDPARRAGGALRVWSAACSTGQEPYSIAMLWDEVGHHAPGLSLKLLATDLSNACLTKARAGLYSPFEVQRGLPVQKLMRHFEQEGQNWRVKPALRAMVSWRQLNLLNALDSVGPFDVVFCRNVLIYFDRATRARILGAIAERLVPGGYLILGASETVIGLTTAFQPSPGAAGLYVKAGPSGAERSSGRAAARG